MTRRDRIARSFSQASTTYSQAAQLQVCAARSLADRVLRGTWNAPRVLEVGCGTGELTRLLLGRLTGPWQITDIAPAMLAAARARLAGAPNARFRLMDGEHPDLPAGSVDLIVSNLAAQWFEDLPAALNRLADCLAPGGRMVLTTLGQSSLNEWRLAVQATGHATGTPAYPSASELAAMLPGAKVSGRTIALTYRDGGQFLKSLKAIGAAVPANGYTPLPAPTLRQAIARLGAPCTASYRVLTMDWTGPR